ncbi:aspartate aminotransferase [bacterium BMS3Abin04]|nr:aspartate aminotransferase [bacterium BMS3Abin04]
MHASKRLSYIGVSPTMKVSAKAKKMKSEGIEVIDLSVGEPDFPTPGNIKEAAKHAIDDNRTKYTINVGLPELREAIANKLKRDNNLDYSISEIVVSSGAKQSLFNTILSMIYVGDELIIPAPYWVSYPHMVSIAQGETVTINTEEENGFRVTPEQLESAVSPFTKGILICNPSNPTGSAYSKKELEELIEVLDGKEIYIIADEIYEKLVYDDYKFVSIASFSEKIKRKTVVINGVSKAYSMTGWRIGFAAGPEEIIGGINKIQSHSTSNASSISQYAAIEAFNGPQEDVEKMRVEFQKRRNFIYDALTSIPNITCYKPNGAFYLFPNISSYLGKSYGKYKINNSVDLAMYLLESAEVAAVPGSAFGSEGFIRVSFATSLQNLELAFKRIQEALMQLS